MRAPLATICSNEEISILKAVHKKCRTMQVVGNSPALPIHNQFSLEKDVIKFRKC